MGCASSSAPVTARQKELQSSNEWKSSVNVVDQLSEQRMRRKGSRSSQTPALVQYHKVFFDIAERLVRIVKRFEADLMMIARERGVRSLLDLVGIVHLSIFIEEFVDPGAKAPSLPDLIEEEEDEDDKASARSGGSKGSNEGEIDHLLRDVEQARRGWWRGTHAEVAEGLCNVSELMRKDLEANIPTAERLNLGVLGAALSAFATSLKVFGPELTNDDEEGTLFRANISKYIPAS